jgi:hypothetical protein
MFNPRTLATAVACHFLQSLTMIDGWEEIEGPAAKHLDVFLEPEVHHRKTPPSDPEGAAPLPRATTAALRVIFCLR